MRLTLHLEDDLVADAEAYTGIHDKSRLVHAAIVALIEHEAAIRLARLGGTEPRLTGKPRRQLPKKR